MRKPFNHKLTIEPTEKINYLIVGQGLAGTLLAWFLLSEKKSVKIIDHPRPNAASQVAAGIMNPITGHRFVKSWMIENLFPFAETTYREIEAFLGQKFYYKKNIVRGIFLEKDEKAWWLRTADETYQKYFNENLDFGEFEGKIGEALSWCELTKSGQTDVPKLVNSFRNHFKKEEILDEQLFDYQEIITKDNSIIYKNIEAEKIIFCEGIEAEKNPWFGYLPFKGSKGEVLIIRIPNADFSRMLKHKIFLVPLGDNLYWTGSFYDRDYETEKPTEKGRKYLEEKLRLALKIPFEIIEHKSAVRPTVKDRRPFLGLHPEFPQLAIFNGLGTKGASLGPYFAKEMTDFLVSGKALNREADIRRVRFPRIS